MSNRKLIRPSLAELKEQVPNLAPRKRPSPHEQTNAENFYSAELEAIRSAQKSVNLEAYIFQKGEVARRFVDAFAERARAGVGDRLPAHHRELRGPAGPLVRRLLRDDVQVLGGIHVQGRLSANLNLADELG